MKDNNLTILTNEATPVEDSGAETARAALAEATALRATDEATTVKRDPRPRRHRAIQALAGIADLQLIDSGSRCPRRHICVSAQVVVDAIRVVQVACRLNSP